MQWTDMTLGAWKTAIVARHGDTQFESGGTRSTVRIHAKQGDQFVGEFIVLSQGADDATTRGKGNGQ